MNMNIWNEIVGTYSKIGSGEAQPRRGSVEERSLQIVNEHRRRSRNAGSARQNQILDRFSRAGRKTQEVRNGDV